MSSVQMADELGQQLPATRNLHESLSRAEDWATRRKHSVVGLDHLMLALGQDPDAVAILMACKVNVEALCRDLIRKLGPEARILSPNAVPPTFDVTVQNLIAHASAAALSSGQSEIDGANLLSAIISGEGGMITHKILEKHGLTFEEALKKLSQKSEQQKAKNPPQATDQLTDKTTAQPAAEKTPKPPQGPQGPQSFEGVEQKSSKVSTQETTQKTEQKPDLNVGLRSDDLLDTGQQPGQQPGKQPQQDIYKGTIIQSEAHPSDYDISADPDADHPIPPMKPQAGQQQSSSPKVDNLKLKIKAKQKGSANQQPASQHPAGRQPDGAPPPPPDVSTGPIWEKVSFNPADRAQAAGQPPMPAQQRAGTLVNGPQAKDQSAAPLPGQGGQPLRSAVGQAQSKSLGRGLTQPPAQTQKPGAYPPPSGIPPVNPQVPAVTPGTVPVAGHTPLAPTGMPSIAPSLQPGLHPASLHPTTSLQPSLQSSLQPMPPQAYRPLQDYRPERLPLQPPHPDGQISMQELGAQINRTGQELRNIAPEDQVIENIPKVMRKGKVHFIEVRVARFANTELDFDPDQYGLRAKQDKVPVIKAITVRLTGPDGQFLIDSANSSTQWTEIHNGVDEADFAVWRWRILPQRSGKSKLRLDITARTSSENGITAEIPVQPSRSFDVKVTRNYGAIINRLLAIVIIFGLGYGIAGYGQELLTSGQAYMQQLTADEE